jgi:hypothetical protein
LEMPVMPIARTSSSTERVDNALHIGFLDHRRERLLGEHQDFWGPGTGRGRGGIHLYQFRLRAGDRYLRRRRQPGQARDQLANPLGVVPHRKARNNAAGLVKDADSMGGTAPIHSRVVGWRFWKARLPMICRGDLPCACNMHRTTLRVPNP